MLFVPPSMPLMIPEAFAIQDKGDFKLVYHQTNNYADYESWIQGQYFEDQVKWLNEKFRLPHDVTIIVGECGNENAYYNPNKKEIVYCYELIALNYQFMTLLDQHGWEFAPQLFCKPAESNCTKFDPTVEARTLNVIDSIFYHEFGHAIIDVYDLNIPAAHEDTADSVSAYVLLKFADGNSGNDAIRDAAWQWLLFSYYSEEQAGLEFQAYADEHSLSIQRFFNLSCYAYGSNPSLNGDLVQLGLLPQERADRCPGEYRKLVSSWDRLLKPYLQTSTYTPPTPTPTPTPTPAPIPEPPPTSKINVTTNKTSYQNEDVILISGKVKNRSSDQDVTIMIVSPSGNVIFL